MKHYLSWELLPPVLLFFKADGLLHPFSFFPPSLMFRQRFENVKMLFVPNAQEQLFLGLFFVGGRSQQMLPHCCTESWHVNQGSVTSRLQEGAPDPGGQLNHDMLLGHSPTLCCWLWGNYCGMLGSLLSSISDRVLCLSGTAPNSPVSLPESPISPSVSGPWGDECTICYENMVDTVIYSCGHMCLCYSCGLKLKKMANACCPICRRAIKDIIKTYRST